MFGRVRGSRLPIAMNVNPSIRTTTRLPQVWVPTTSMTSVSAIISTVFIANTNSIVRNTIA